jgi:hypothetical protein
MDIHDRAFASIASMHSPHDSLIAEINLFALSLPDMEPVSLARVDPMIQAQSRAGPVEEDLLVAMETWKVPDGSHEGFNLEMRKGSERLALLRRSHR